MSSERWALDVINSIGTTVVLVVLFVSIRGCQVDDSEYNRMRLAIDNGYVQDVKDGQVIWVRERNDEPGCSNLE